MSSTKPYNRVLLKLSGEQFAGDREYGVDPQFITKLAVELRETIEATGVQLVIVVGGGNIMRGAAVSKRGIDRATGDYMGMLATLINGMALVNILEDNGVPARLQTRVRADQVAEPYIRARGLRPPRGHAAPLREHGPRRLHARHRGHRPPGRRRAAAPGRRPGGL